MFSTAGSEFLLRLAQEVKPEYLEPPINWVFYMYLIVGAGFFGFLGFLFLYYVVGVLAKNRRLGATAPVVTSVPPVARVPVAAAVAPAAAKPAATVPAAAPAAPASATPVAAEPASAPAPTSAAPASPSPAPGSASGEPAGGVPRINPNVLPDGIDAVTRGRLKKLAIFQDRGNAPPRDLIENLKDTLEQISGGSIDVDAATTAQAAPAAPSPEPAPAAPSPEPATAAPSPEASAEPVAPSPEPAPEPTAPAPAVPDSPAPAEEASSDGAAGETFGLPRIDPNNLPAGLDPVAKGRMKKLAVFQDRGKKPPDELVEALKSVLDSLST